MKRSIFRGICVAGLLACMVTIVAPVAYGGEGLLEDVPEPPPVTSTVTEVTATVPAVPSTEGVVEQVNTATAPATETTTNVTDATNVGQGDTPVVEPTEVVQNVSSTSVATSTPDAPSTSIEAPSVSSSNDAPATTGRSGATTAGTGAGGTSASGSTSTTTGSGPSTRPAQMIPTWSTSLGPRAERASLRGGVFFAQAEEGPEDILDELLGIGNSVGVDQVRGLLITNARGSNDEAPASSGAPSSTPAPLAFTGIAIGAFLAIGCGLLVAGSGARAAGSTSAA